MDIHVYIFVGNAIVRQFSCPLCKLWLENALNYIESIFYLLTMTKIKCIETIHSLQCCHFVHCVTCCNLSAYCFKLAGVAIKSHGIG